jgi:hypothetical protein
MRGRGRMWIAATALVLLWAGFAYDLSRPPDGSDYHRTVLQVTRTAHDAAATGALIGRQQLDGRVFGPFAVSAYRDATRAMGSARRRLTEQAPPDGASMAQRDRIAPIMGAAADHLGDAASARDDARLRAAVDDLEHDVRQLATLLRAWQ